MFWTEVGDTSDRPYLDINKAINHAERLVMSDLAIVQIAKVNMFNRIMLNHQGLYQIQDRLIPNCYHAIFTMLYRGTPNDIKSFALWGVMVMDDWKTFQAEVFPVDEYRDLITSPELVKVERKTIQKTFSP